MRNTNFLPGFFLRSSLLAQLRQMPANTICIPVVKRVIITSQITSGKLCDDVGMYLNVVSK